MILIMLRVDLHGLAPHGDADAQTHPYGANWLFMKGYLSDPDLSREYARFMSNFVRDEYRAYWLGAIERGVFMELSARYE